MDPIIREIKKKIQTLEADIKRINRTQVVPGIRDILKRKKVIIHLRRMAATLNGKPIRVRRKKAIRQATKKKKAKA